MFGRLPRSFKRQMKTVITILLGIAAIVATLSSGVLHGRIRHKFGLGEDLTQQVRWVESLPSEIGTLPDGRPAWVRVGDPQELTEEVVGMLECAGYYQAMYQSSVNPEYRVSLLILVGPSGPLLVHSPEVCYPASGNQYLSGPDQVEVRTSDGRKAELQTMMFKNGGLVGGKSRVGYAFSVDGEQWSSPKNARQLFAGQPFLYKMQLHATLPADFQVSDDNDPLEKFIEAFTLTPETN